MPNKYDEADSRADVAIIGLGPGGLAAALRAATAKPPKQVVAFTNRLEYVRGQRISLTPETVKFLEQFKNPTDPEDKKFFGRIKMEESHAQTKDIERYMIKKLAKFPNVSIVEVDKDENYHFVADGESGQNKIVLKNNESYFFKHLLTADGARHTVADQLQKDLGVQLSYKESPFQLRHKHHAVVQLQLKAGYRSPELKEDDARVFSPKEKMEQFNQLGWDKSYMPKSILLENYAPTGKRKKYYLAGEVPEKIHLAKPEERPELLRKWAAIEIKDNYGLEEPQLEYRQSVKHHVKNKLQSASFEMNIVGVDKPCIELPGSSGAFFGQVGDARQTPNYQFGHGLNDAITGGIAFVDSITPSCHFEKNKFDKKIQELDEVFSERMSSMKNQGMEQKKEKQQEVLNSFNKLIDEVKDEPNLVEKLEKTKVLFEKDTNIDEVFNSLNEVKTIIIAHPDEVLIPTIASYIEETLEVSSVEHANKISPSPENAEHKGNTQETINELETHLSDYMKRGWT